MHYSHTLLLIAVNLFCAIHSLDNGLALAPPMGWMTWLKYGCSINESLIKKTADLMVDKGFLTAGYKYIIVDDCWSSKTRHNGKLIADSKKFPSGIKALIDYVHDKGLLFGLYTSMSEYTCEGYPGSKNYLRIDAATFAKWGIDYIKVDACFSSYSSMVKDFVDFGRYLNLTNRYIVYSSSWPFYFEYIGKDPNYDIVSKTCNLWRNYYDISKSWYSLSSTINWYLAHHQRLVSHAGPGRWNDLDELIIGNDGITLEQAKTQMAFWCIIPNPLIISIDFAKLSSAHRNILLNNHAISVNQDPLGKGGMLIATIKSLLIWKKKLINTVIDCESSAILFYNPLVHTNITIKILLTAINLTCSSGYEVLDIFNSTRIFNLQFYSSIAVNVAATALHNIQDLPQDHIHVRKKRLEPGQESYIKY